MTETIEQLCQRILDARGYLVVSDTEELKPGQVSVKATNAQEFGILRCPLVCIAETDIEDLNRQRSLVGKPPRQSLYGERHYRMIAE